jgi:hypothetical protein
MIYLYISSLLFFVEDFTLLISQNTISILSWLVLLIIIILNLKGISLYTYFLSYYENIVLIQLAIKLRLYDLKKVKSVNLEFGISLELFDVILSEFKRLFIRNELIKQHKLSVNSNMNNYQKRLKINEDLFLMK